MGVAELLSSLTLSNAVEHALGWVAQKMGFLLEVVMMAMAGRTTDIGADGRRECRKRAKAELHGRRRVCYSLPTEQ
jgi:hypothetical protein